MKKHYLPNWFVRTVALSGFFASGYSLHNCLWLSAVELVISIYIYWLGHEF